MAEVITATKLARGLSRILDRVKRGERFTVLRNGIPVAIIRPIESKKGITVKEFVDLWDTISKPDEDFWKDLEEIHNSETMMEPPRSI